MSDITSKSWEALNQLIDPRDVNSEGEEGWLIHHPCGGLVQKYLSNNIGIAFCRSECSAGEAAQDGFVLHVGHQLFETRSACDAVGLRKSWFDGKQSFMLPQIVELANVEKHPVSTVVSFCSFDHGSFETCNPLFVFHVIYGSQKPGGSCADREIGWVP
jgi:hypothetical protein